MAYKRSVYQQAKEALDQRRAQAERLGQQRHAEIIAQCPAIAETEREMAACGAELIKVAYRGEQVEQKIAALSQRNLDAQQQRAKLLQAMGYAPDYLDNVYTCPICKDTGTHGNYYCTCYLDLIRQTAKESIKGAAQLKKCTFDTFSLRYYSDTPDPALGRSHREIMRRVGENAQRELYLSEGLRRYVFFAVEKSFNDGQNGSWQNASVARRGQPCDRPRVQRLLRQCPGDP